MTVYNIEKYRKEAKFRQLAEMRRAGETLEENAEIITAATPETIEAIRQAIFGAGYDIGWKL